MLGANAAGFVKVANAHGCPGRAVTLAAEQSLSSAEQY